MYRLSISALAVAGLVLVSQGASAQGVERGAREGAREGERIGGPAGGVIGGIVGGVVGGAQGAVDGILGRDARPRFRGYVTEQRRPSYVYTSELRPGVILPEDGPAYYDAPDEFGLRTYRYTVVNGQVVIVDPMTRRIVDIVE